jgi:hypothetical protein
MTRSVKEHPYMEHAEMLRDMARALRTWITTDGGRTSDPPVPLTQVGVRDGESEAWATYRQLHAEANRLALAARSDEVWLRGDA